MNVQLSALDLAEMLRSENPPHLLDVRELEEHQFVALPNSRLLPLGELPARVSELAGWKNDEIVVYCHHGIRSLHAIGFLREQGFTKLRNLSGGIHAWSVVVDDSLPRY